MSEQLRTLPRWGLCLLLVLGLHVGVALWSLYWRPESKPIELAPPPPAMMVALAPAAAAAAAPAAPPPPPEPVVQPKPIEAPKPKLALPPPKPKTQPQPPKSKTEAKPVPKAEPQSQPVAQSQPQNSAPAASNAARSDAKPASQSGSPESSNALPSWQGILRAHLSRYKRYPPESRRRGDEGTVTLRFKIDGQGRLLSFELVSRSGRTALDQATLQMIRRAEPLPPPPPELLTNGTLEVVAPFAYTLQDR